MDEYLNKKIMLDEFVTHNMPLEKINEAFDLMHSGKRFVDKLVYKTAMEILYCLKLKHHNNKRYHNNILSLANTGCSVIYIYNSTFTVTYLNKAEYEKLRIQKHVFSNALHCFRLKQKCQSDNCGLHFLMNFKFLTVGLLNFS